MHWRPTRPNQRFSQRVQILVRGKNSWVKWAAALGLSLVLLTTLMLVTIWSTYFREPAHPKYTRLMAAIEANDVGRVVAALNAGANPNFCPSDEVNLRNEDDIAPLDTAIAEGHLEIARTLLKYGANPNMGDGWNSSPLEAAADRDWIDAMQLLLDKGAKVNDTKEMSTALWRAAVSGYARSVAFLLHHGANPNSYMTYKHDRTTLLTVVEGDESDQAVMRMLKEAGAHE